MKALTIKETGALGRAGIVDIPEPAIRPGYIKVKTVAVALNPSELLVTPTWRFGEAERTTVDWKHIEFIGEPGLLLGTARLLGAF